MDSLITYGLPSWVKKMIRLIPLKQKLVWIIFKNSVRTAKKTLHFKITKINWLTLFKEIIAVYTENHTKPINIKWTVTDFLSRWYIYLPLGFRGLILFSKRRINLASLSRRCKFYSCDMFVRYVRVLQILLNLARSIFEEQNNLECLVTKIMTEARDLLKCERCAVFLLDTECCEAVSTTHCHSHPFRI
jgi:hypothetical protein